MHPRLHGSTIIFTAYDENIFEFTVQSLNGICILCVSKVLHCSYYHGEYINSLCISAHCKQEAAKKMHVCLHVCIHMCMCK